MSAVFSDLDFCGGRAGSVREAVREARGVAVGFFEGLYEGVLEFVESGLRVTAAIQRRQGPALMYEVGESQGRELMAMVRADLLPPGALVDERGRTREVVLLDVAEGRRYRVKADGAELDELGVRWRILAVHVDAQR